MDTSVATVFNSKLDSWKSSLNNKEVFSEVPVPLDEFIHSGKFLNIKKLSPLQTDCVLHGTLIYRDAEIEKLGWEKIRRVGELVACCGKGGGKDFVSQVIQARIAYLLLCLNSPQRYYEQALVSSIDMLNMAYSADQAESVFFKTFCQMISDCQWFSNKAQVLKNKIQFDKKVAAYSGSSYEEAFEGKNLIICVLDEISAFKTKMEVEHLAKRRLRVPRYSGEAVYDMAKSSVESRFGRGIGKVISISWPRFKNDLIQQLYEKGKKESSVFVVKGATWEFNPTKKMEDFEDERRKNPERWSSRYAADPMGVEGGYFKDKEAISRAFPVIEEDKVPTTQDLFPELKDWFKCKHSFPCVMSLDLGLKHDKAGLTLSHVYDIREVVKKGEGGAEFKEKLPLVEIDLMVSFIVPFNGELSIDRIRKFILEVRSRGFNISKFMSDTFQSWNLQQNLITDGIEAEFYSVDRNTEAYDCLKELIYDGRLKGYSYLRTYDTGTGLRSENEVVNELTNLIFDGRKIDHVGFSAKDLCDSAASSVRGAVELGFSSLDLSEISEGSERVVSERVDTGDREYLTPLGGSYEF